MWVFLLKSKGYCGEREREREKDAYYYPCMSFM